MIFIILLIAIILIVFSKKITKSKISFLLITVYILWYGFWLGISTFNFYGLFEVSYQAYTYQLLGMVALVFGFLFHSNSSILYKNKNLNKSIDLKFQKSRWFQIAFGSSLFYVFSVFIKFRNIVINSQNNVRTVFFGEDKALIYGHRYLGAIWGWLGVSIFYSVLLLLSINLLNKRIFNRWTFLYFLFIVFYGFIGAGRQNYVILLEMLFIVYIISINTNLISTYRYSISLRKSPVLVIGFLLLFSMVGLALGYMTSIRQGYSEFTLENSLFGLGEFFKQIVGYNIGPFRAFDYALSHDYIEKIGQLYGRGTFAAIDHAIYTFFTYLRVEIFYPANGLIGSVLQLNLINIGGDFANFNYAYTQFLIFYLDFGVVGIVFFSFLFGYFYSKSVNYFLNSPNFFSLLLLVFLSLSLMNSNFAYQLQSISALIIIVSTIHLSKKYQSKRNLIKRNLIKR